MEVAQHTRTLRVVQESSVKDTPVVTDITPTITRVVAVEVLVAAEETQIPAGRATVNILAELAVMGWLQILRERIFIMRVVVVRVCTGAVGCMLVLVHEEAGILVETIALTMGTVLLLLVLWQILAVVAVVETILKVRVAVDQGLLSFA